MTTKRKAIIIALALALVLAFPAISALTKTRMEDLHPKNEWEIREAVKKTGSPHESGKVDIPLPQAIGPVDAPVKIESFTSPSNHCHNNTVEFLCKLSEEEPYKGRLRVEFLNMSDPDVKRKANAAKIGCDAGLLMNGKAAMKVPGHGEAGLVIFTGPVNEKNYKEDDLRAAVDLLLKGKPALKAKGAA